MATIDKLEYINNTKNLIKNALNTKFNSQIEDGDTFRSYAQKIDDIYENWPKVSEENTNFTLNSTKEGKMKIELKGNTSQESTTGKNLLQPSFQTQTSNGVTCTYTEKGWNINGALSRSSAYFIIFNKILNAGTYTINGLPNGNYDTFQIVVLFNGDWSNVKYVTSNKLTFTLDTSKGVQFRLFVYDTYGTFNNLLLPYQLETGSTATSYEPYTGGNPAPNPDYPYPVNVVTGNNSIKVFSKNIVTSYRKSTDMLIIVVNKSLITSKTITLSMISSEALNNNSLYIHYDSTQKFLTTMTASANTRQQKTITFTDAQMNKIKSANYVYFHIYKSSSAFTNVQEVQIEMGGNVTSYQNYQTPQTYPINLGSMELCKIGDYQDYIYKENGIWYKYGAIGKVVLDGSENWNVSNTGTPNYIYYAYINNFKPLTTGGYSNYYTFISIGGSDTNQGIFAVSDYVRIRYGTEDTVANFKTWLSSHNVELYYVLNTPTITPITDTILIEQLNAIQQAMSYNNQTNISQTNNDLPFIINASALKKND